MSIQSPAKIDRRVHTHLPYVLLKKSMDNDPNKRVEHNVEQVTPSMLVERLWHRLVVQSE